MTDNVSWSQRFRFNRVPTAETTAVTFAALPVAVLYDLERLDHRTRLEIPDLSRAEDRLCAALTDWINVVRASAAADEVCSFQSKRTSTGSKNKHNTIDEMYDAMLTFHKELYSDLRRQAIDFIDLKAFERGEVRPKDKSAKAKKFADFLREQIAISVKENELTGHLKGDALLDHHVERISERQTYFIQNGLDTMYPELTNQQR